MKLGTEDKKKLITLGVVGTGAIFALVYIYSQFSTPSVPAAPVAPVIVSGNTCVVVASESRPCPAVTLTEVLPTSDLPGGVVNLSALTINLADPNITQQIVGTGSQIETAGTVNGVASGQSLTIAGGIFTGTTYPLFPNAHLMVVGGVFRATTFYLDAGASVKCQGVCGGLQDGAFKVTLASEADRADVAGHRIPVVIKRTCQARKLTPVRLSIVFDKNGRPDRTKSKLR